MVDDAIPRRKFLLGAGVAGTAAVAGLGHQDAVQAQVAPQPATAQATPGAGPEPLLVLTLTEAAFISAAADTLIPADELSPSGSECGVTTFVDRQLASAWGGGDKMYRSGPFHQGKPEQGNQLPLTPREFFAVGIAAANEWSRTTHGKEFDRLSAEDRATALKTMEAGKAQFAGVDAKTFFEALLAITMEGFFSDPMYGGNRDSASWKMIGFPGLPATYANVVDEYFNKRYVAPPQSIADFS